MDNTKSLLERSMSIKTGDEATPVYDQDISVMLRMMQDMLVYGAPNIKRQSTNALRNSIRIEGSKIIIGGGSVSYAYDTNADWSELPYRNGLKNPNEAWVDRIVKQALIIFARKYGYKVVYN
jgi:hypothetical protein